MSGPLLEVCVDDAEGLAAAVRGGADRIELCASLSVGGLTPSYGFMRHAAGCGRPVYAMIRPRAGSFVFDGDEVAVMCADIDATRSAGLSGVVLGASRSDGALDAAVLQRLTARAEGLGTTLHRAFDLVNDVEEALETAVALGFERILTSGGRTTALEGVERLSLLTKAARGRISVMPGSGVRLETVEAILDHVDPTEIHASCAVNRPCDDPALVALGFSGPTTRVTDAETVRALKARLAGWRPNPRQA